MNNEMGERMARMEQKLEDMSDKMDKIETVLDRIADMNTRVTRNEERLSYHSKLIHAVGGAVLLLAVETAVVLIARWF